MSAREEILGRVRAALADVRPAAGARPQTAGPTPTGVARAQLVAQFVARASEYRASVRLTAPDALRAAIGQVLRTHGACRVAIPPALPSRWIPPGVEPVADRRLAARELDALDAVLTGCALAVAETGTLVLDGGPRCGRRALTLVPDLHVCVVDAAQIVAGLDDAFAALTAARPLTLVSGPSATSDIELARVEGVHGPRRLEILVVS